MIANLAFMALAAGAPAQEASATDARLAAFAEFCLPERFNPTALISGFQEAGWVLSDASANPELAAVMQLDRDKAAEAEVTIHATVLRRSGLFATVNVSTAVIAEDETAHYATCAVWDFDATAGIPDNQASNLAGVAPVVRLDRPYGRIVQWNLSDSLAGAGNLQTSYFPEGSPAIVQTGFTGAAIFLTTDLEARP